MTVGSVDRDPATAEFFDGTQRGEFLLRRCPLRHYSEPSAALCTTCGSGALEWAAAAGGARLISWAVTWTRPTPEAEPAPTVLAIAELDEGPWWWSQLAADPANLAVGDRLRIAFATADSEHPPVPVFELVR